MHVEVLEDKKARCKICGMDLEPVRLVTMYTCPVHAVIEQASAGKCRICSRELVAMTAALTFTCRDNLEVKQIEPGKCADGSPMVARYAQRPHGDHNPKHGGIFFMAADNWHHLEGTYPAPGRFRVYLYDDYSRPLKPADARNVRGRVVLKEEFDPKTGSTRELTTAPLTPARNGAYLEARFDPISLPAKLTAKVSFKSAEKESRFDFTFQQLSADLPVRVPARVTQPSRAADTSALADLKGRQAEVEALLKEGNLSAIYVPALQAKDMALEIQTQHSGRTGIDTDALEASVKQIVLAAYQLDNYGDMGDGSKVQEAFAAFNSAIAALDSVIAGRRP